MRNIVKRNSSRIKKQLTQKVGSLEDEAEDRKESVRRLEKEVERLKKVLPVGRITGGRQTELHSSY